MRSGGSWSTRKVRARFHYCYNNGHISGSSQRFWKCKRKKVKPRHVPVWPNKRDSTAASSRCPYGYGDFTRGRKANARQTYLKHGCDQFSVLIQRLDLERFS